MHWQHPQQLRVSVSTQPFDLNTPLWHSAVSSSNPAHTIPLRLSPGTCSNAEPSVPTHDSTVPNPVHRRLLQLRRTLLRPPVTHLYRAQSRLLADLTSYNLAGPYPTGAFYNRVKPTCDTSTLLRTQSRPPAPLKTTRNVCDSKG